jgi:sarcosine oxidase
MRYDAIVIGVGGIGSAAAYHIARRGRSVLGIEQFNIPHDLGSSHGVNRIIRLAYAEDPRYVPLLRRAYELWRELEELAGERLLVITGGVDAGAESSATITGSLRSCREHNLPH